MPCLDCKHFAPIEVASVANATIRRTKPCVVSDFDPYRLGRLTLPMTADSFWSAVETYECDQWEERGGITG